MHGLAEIYHAQQMAQLQQEQDRLNAMIPVEGLIALPVNTTSHIVPRDLNGKEYALRHDFKASVFYIPDTPANARARAVLKEGDTIIISTMMPADMIGDATQMHPGTITFDTLKLDPAKPQPARSANADAFAAKAIDPRTADQIDGIGLYTAPAPANRQATVHRSMNP